MGRLNKLTSRALASGALLAGATVLTQGLFIKTAKAVNPACSTLPSVVYVSGSSAVKPVLAGLGKALSAAASPTTIAYLSAGSCVGVQAALGTPAAAATWTYWDSTGTALSCDTSTTQVVDIGVSDVFATTCPTVTADQVSTAGIGDFDTFFNQVMEFVVPALSDAHSISAEAAYLTFGLGNESATRWDNQDLLLVRNQNSGTQAMWSKVLKLPATKWLGHDEGGSGQVVKDITNKTNPVTTQAGDPQKLLGIVSSGEADADTVNIKKLSFQDYGQTCAFWPDSGVSAKDKKYVRDGHYPTWGPLHVLAKATNGVPTDAKVKAIIDLFKAQDKSTLDIEIAAHVVPVCAMNVTRDSEIGPLSSFQPTGSCGCYFDKATTGATTCTTCTDTCTGGKVCNYGYCEAK
jgi:ABC-type phosphate transport system substrate-binding protein